MALPALVLVHGGQHAADCWDPTVDEIHCQAPGLTVLSLDLPGRRGTCHNLMVSEPELLAGFLLERCRRYA